MLPIQHIQKGSHTANTGLALKTGLAFRPFFWLGAVFLLLSLALWSLFWQGSILVSPYGGMLWWHQHEMLFGFTAAIVAGFLLTAVQNWTGLPSLSGPPLFALVFLWLAARFLLLFPLGLPVALICAVDVLFLPLVALAVGRLVVKAKRWRNLIFVPVLLLYTAANIGLHYGQINRDPYLVQQSSYLAVWVVLSLIIILGGRVIPFFTSRALGVVIQAPAKWREVLVVVSTLAMSLLFFISMFGVVVPKILFAIALAFIVVLNFWRWLGWKLKKCWHEPLLWGLHLSYLFVIIGAFLWFFAVWNLLPTDYALHLLTVNGILGMILSMTARVSLGHTGRPIQALPGLGLALCGVFAAGVIRGPMLWVWPTAALGAYQISLILSALAFVWFVVYYTVPLWCVRVDGKPG